MSIKKLLLLLIFTSTFGTLVAQDFYIEAGKNTSTFDYKNSSGASSLNTNFSKVSKSRAAIGLRWNLWEEKLKASTGITYDEHLVNATYQLNSLGAALPLSYELNYMAVKLGLHLLVLKMKKTSIQLQGGLSANWLNYGKQQNGNKMVDLTTQEAFKGTTFKYQYGVGIEYPITKTASIYGQYNINNSLRMVESEGANLEEFTLDSQNITIGVLIHLGAKKQQKATDTLSIADKKPVEEILVPKKKTQKQLPKLKDKNSKIQISAIQASVVIHEQPVIKKIIPLKKERDETNVFFAINSAVIMSSYWNTLEDVVTQLKRNASLKVTIIGYADNSGLEKPNLELSKNRVLAVLKFLTSAGIYKTQCIVLYRGATKEFSEITKELNRRVSIRVH